MEVRRLALAGGAVLALWLALESPPARAVTSCSASTTFQVDTTSDENDGGSAGDPAGPDGKVSIREAIEAAGNTGGQATIEIPSGHYTLGGTLSIPPGCGLTIQGRGARTTVIDGAGSHSVLSNHDATTIEDLTITGGHNASGGGGGILNQGNLTLTDDALVGNSAEFGGGVANPSSYPLVVSGSTFANNSAAGGTAGSEGGGAIYNNGSATITNSTINNNTAGPNNGSGGLGGGIYADNSSSTTLNYVTLDGNTATGTSPSGGDLGGAGSVYKYSTIFAAGNPNGCSKSTSSPSSGDTSISDDGTCGGLQEDPELGPLQDNGGPTDTQMLLSGSPAIDTGELAQCTPSGYTVATTDQRGVSRPQGSSCDIGAYELVQSGDLALAASASPSPATVGQPLTFRFTISSTGTANDAVEPTLTDTLPAALQFVSGSTGCSASGQTVRCSPGAVADGSNVVVTVVTTPTIAGPVSTTATVASPRPDSNASNDSASAGVTVQPAPPILSKLKLKPTAFSALGFGAPVAARNHHAALGATVSYALNSTARVKFTVERSMRGHKNGKGRCVSAERKHRKACTLFKPVGGFSHEGAAGADSFKFSGRIGGHKLAPGKYRLVAVATDSLGRSSSPASAKFLIIK